MDSTTAVSKMNTPEALVRNVLSLKTCGICQHVCVEPRTLECLHSFCLECLKQLFDSTHDSENVDFMCPTCSIEIIPPPGSTVDNMFLEYLKTDKMFSQDLGMVGCKKHPNYICEYLYQDTLELACDVCVSERGEGYEGLTQKGTNDVRNKRHQSLNKTISATKCELNEICENFKSLQNQMLAKNDETVLGIMKYFMDLKMQINDYLTRHEQEVLEKLKNFAGIEMSKMVTFSKHCLSLLQSMDSKFSFLYQPFSNSQQINTSNILSIICGLNVFQSHVDEYSAKVRTVKQSLQDDVDIKFVINTEFEDMLTGGDLINIELINSNVQSSTGSNISDNRQSQGSEPDTIESTTNTTIPTQIDPITITISPPTAPSNTDFPDDPPPPYPGLELDDFTLRQQYRNQLDESVAFGTPQISPSAPSLEDVFTIPVIPRGLTHGMNQEPITPPGASRDSHLLDIQPLRKFPVRSREQRSIPNLVDISWVNGDTLVALDKRNTSVVVLSDQGAHLNSSFFKFEPYSCTVYELASQPGVKMAVSFPKERKLIFYEIHVRENFRIKLEYETKTVKGYTCIKFSEQRNKFICATTSPFSLPSVDLLDFRGNFLKSFNGSDAVMLGYPRSVQVDNEGIVAVSDYKTSRVLFMNAEGTHRSVFNGSDVRNLSDPQGIGFYENMNLFFIADTRANRLFCVDSDGLVCDEFGENSMLEKTPRFIDFSRSTYPRLAIGHGNGYISLYNVNRPITYSAV